MLNFEMGTKYTYNSEIQQMPIFTKWNNQLCR
jgi:hypothetical protein